MSFHLGPSWTAQLISGTSYGLSQELTSNALSPGDHREGAAQWQSQNQVP